MSIVYQSNRGVADNAPHRTGEIPWIKKMIEKHHEAAKAKGTIVSTNTDPIG